MIDAARIADRYVALWNETDPARRRELIAGAWTEDATYVDPLMRGEGHDGLDALIAAVHRQFPDIASRWRAPRTPTTTASGSPGRWRPRARPPWRGGPTSPSSPRTDG
jgi:SnoaL-like domain